MYTIQEVAEILNITPQAVYKKINNQLNNELATHLKQVERGNKTVKAVTSEGLEIIRKSLEQPVDNQFNNEFNNQFNNQFKDSSKGKEDNLIQLLEETIQTLKKQLDVKDKQIQDLNERLKEQQELNRNNQVLLHREQEQKALVSDTTAWQRLKKVFIKD